MIEQIKSTNSPFPSKSNLLNRLKSSGLPISEVVDVGVREYTMELIQAFPDLCHHLFEPVNLFYSSIDRNYEKIKHILYPVALSDVNEYQYLIVSSLLRDGIGTHSNIRAEEQTVDGKFIVSCESLAVKRFDSLDNNFQTDFLLKIDVDGADLKVLKGFGKRLSMASAVIVEMTFMNFIERSQYLVNNGFELFDLIDLVYYGNSLHQFDATFVRKDLVTEKIRPPIGQFNYKLWCPLVKGG